jgi:hypothetical protein
MLQHKCKVLQIQLSTSVKSREMFSFSNRISCSEYLTSTRGEEQIVRMVGKGKHDETETEMETDGQMDVCRW